jgi:urea transport system substrate-binding protein
MAAEEKPFSAQSDRSGDPDEPNPKLLETMFLPQAAETQSGPEPPPPSLSDQWVGRTLGKYQIIGTLGQGGMGIVLRAHDPMIERDVAIKLLPEQLADDDKALSRFLAEAKAAGKLNHANVVSIYEIGQEGQAYYLVMELITGGSASDGLDLRHAYSVLDATRIAIDACKGLAAAHAVGLIHRDVKPANLLKAADGSFKITDFGLAKTATHPRDVTQAGTVVGTPYFMSPEQCDGKPVDARSDIYSLGATYYSLLTGKNPYEQSDSVMQVMYGHCQGAIPDPRLVNRSVPPACSAIISKAMAKSPAERYQSTEEMLADLQAVAATLSGEVQIRLPSQSGSGAALASTVAFQPDSLTLAAAADQLQPAGQAGQAEQPADQAAEPTRRMWLGAAAGAGLTLLAGGLGVWAVGSRRGDSPTAVGGAPGSEPIRVGVLHSLSGTMGSSQSVVVDATLLAIEQINQAGGLLGRQIEPMVVDARSDPTTFALQAQRLILEQRVCTLFGCWTSASRKAVKQVVEDHDHLLIYPLRYEGVEQSPNIVYMGAAPNQQIIPAVQWAMSELNKQRFFLVGSDYLFPRVAHAIIGDLLTSKGAEVVGEVYLPLGSQDAAEAVDGILRTKPEMILNTIQGDSNTSFFSRLRAAGITAASIPTLSFSIAEQELRSLNIAHMQGDYAAWTYFQSVATAENQQFVKQFHSEYPQRVISDPMESAYVGVQLWAKAVAEAGNIEPTKIRRAMLTQRLVAPSGPIRLDADTQHCFKTPMVGQIRDDGQFDIRWSAPAPLRPQPFPESRSAEDWKGFLHDLYAGWGDQWSAPEL